MKKRTKITLRTKIYLTIVALFALTGALYASMPTFFTTVPNATGVAASRTDLLVSDYAGQPVGNIYQVACDGTFSVFGTVPTFVGFQEKYLAIAPSQSANAGFSPRDVFVTQGALVWRFQGLGSGTVTRTLFTTLQGCASSDHNGITFDHFGTFGFDMLVTCREGNVFRVHGDGTETLIAGPFGIELEGPAVVPPDFGPHGGEMWVADEDGNAIHALKNNDPTGGNCCGYTVSPNILPHFSAEGVFVIPQSPCTFCDSPAPGSTFFQALQQVNQVWRYPLSDFTGLGGNVLLTSEQGGPTSDTSLVTVVNNQYVQTSFGRVAGLNEGGAFVDCDVPTPTPTPTPTATFTPTPTSTPTATATATFTPTPTATATATPTATATATPTATATATPTATATATATPTPTATPTITPPTCGTGFAIGDLDAVVGNKVYFWGAQWWKNNHLSGGRAPASFKGFVNCTNPNPPACGGTWTSDPGNSGHPPDTVPADMTVIVSSLVTKSGPVESGDIPKMVTIHVDPGYGPNPGHEGTGTVTAVICGAGPHQPRRPAPRPR